MKAAVLSNINQDSLIRRLSSSHEIFSPSGYGSWLTDLLSPQSNLPSFAPDVIFIILDAETLFRSCNHDLESIRDEMNNTFSLISQAVENFSKTSFFVSNLDYPVQVIKSLKETSIERQTESFWFEKLALCNKQYSNFYEFDLKNAIETIGRNNFYSRKLWYLGGIKFNSHAEKHLEMMILRIMRAIEGKKKKALLLDCDNTLWGGVIGEEGIEGIQLSDTGLGSRFKDFQAKIKLLRKLGVVLAAVSKNNEEDVTDVLKNHSDMLLKEEDFIVKAINWNHKYLNISQLVEDINIGLDSVVFIDDNPVERESVSQALPSVIVPDFPQDTSDLTKFIDDIYIEHFLTLNATNEDQQKTELYQRNFERAKAKRASDSFDSFLSSLNTKILLYKARDQDVQRVAQLTQKTNQFNLTTHRYSESEIQSFIESANWDVFVAEVVDKFGDNGQVFVALAQKKDSTTIEIDTLLLSCRVMGRMVEDHLMHALKQIWAQEGYSKLFGYYKPTQKNKPTSEIYAHWGFETVEETDQQTVYRYDLNSFSDQRTFHSELIFRKE